MRRRAADPFHIERVEPPDGARGVLRDDPVFLRLSAPLHADGLVSATLEVWEGERTLPARLEILDGRRVVVWWPQTLLRGGCEHRVVVRGLRDRLGREAPPHASRFTPGALSGDDIRS